MNLLKARKDIKKKFALKDAQCCHDDKGNEKRDDFAHVK
jgi:hypothetical protein